MNAWSAQSPDGIFGAIIQVEALEAVDCLCSASDRIETGGVLVGHYSEDLSTAVVLEATPPPPDSKQGHSWFHRGVKGLKELLAQKWQSKNRTYYLGEWHYHPADRVVPSTDDFDQMGLIAHAQEYKCREPLLLIFGASRDESGQRSLRAFVCPIGNKAIELHPKPVK
jgi:integrative and conjugative element protein (TIGR02256 family)